MAEQHLDKIFDPYFSTKEQGHGLGLASTYSIINQHKGHIKVDSQPDKGTLFTTLFPASEKGEETVVGELSVKNDSIHNVSAKILVLDDEEMVRDVVRAMLERMGYSLSFAVDGQEAVAKYQVSYDNELPYDIVIMDLTIPGGMGGQEAAQKILKIEPDAKIIVSSGNAADPVMVNYESFGFKGIAEKPYSFEELKNVIFIVLEM